MSILFVLILLLVFIALVVASGATLFLGGAQAVGRNAKKSMELVPGTPARAPANWFGSHEAEAKLFRRLQEAVLGVHAMGQEQPGSFDTVASIERQALRLEEQLLAASHIADRLKPGVIDQLESAVAQIEEIAAAVIGRDAGMLGSGVKQELDELAERLQLIDQARAQLDEGDQRGGSSPG